MFLHRTLILALGSTPLVGLVVAAIWWQGPRRVPVPEERFIPCPAGSAQLIELPVPEALTPKGKPTFATADRIPAEFVAAVPVPPSFTLTVDRFRVARRTLRRPNAHDFDGKYVSLTLIIGTSGDVLFALPTAGPSELFQEALGAVRDTKIDPVIRDGKPVLIRIDNFLVGIGPPERRLAEPHPLPMPKDWQSLRIGYSENWIGGSKRFQLEIRGDGTVTYLGRSDVALLGRHCARISQAAVARLFKAFQAADFLRLDEKYRGGFSHGPLIRTSIGFDDLQKSVEEFSRGGIDKPDAIDLLQLLVMETAGGRRWTEGNAGTLTALRAEGWDFKRKDTANTSMVAGVARLGDVAAVADLISADAPLGAIDAVAGEEWLLVRDNPLVSAANRGAFDIVDALLRTNATWSPLVLGHALVAGARFGDVAFCRAMLDRGAELRTRDAMGKTALMSAAESGVPEIVELLLTAGASVSDVDEDGETALHWVGKDAPFDRLEPSAMNRRAVVDLLVRAGAEVDAYDRLRYTPLTEALGERPEVVAALIAHGADVNRRVGDNDTALMATYNPETILLLLQAGADPSLRDKDGRTAIESLKATTERLGETARWRDRREHEQGLRAVAVLEQWMAAHPRTR